MDGPYSVWAYNEDPTWLAGNVGVPDMVITSGTLHDAHFAAQRIRLIAPDVDIEIRNSRDEIITVQENPNPGHNPTLEIVGIGPRPARRTDRPKRRTLGTREH